MWCNCAHCDGYGRADEENGFCEDCLEDPCAKCGERPKETDDLCYLCSGNGNKCFAHGCSNRMLQNKEHDSHFYCFACFKDAKWAPYCQACQAPADEDNKHNGKAYCGDCFKERCETCDEPCPGDLGKPLAYGSLSVNLCLDCYAKEAPEVLALEKEEVDCSLEPVSPDVYFFPAEKPEKKKEYQHSAWDCLMPLSQGPIVGDYLVDYVARRVSAGQDKWTVIAYKIIKKTPKTATIFSTEQGEILLNICESSWYKNKTHAGEAYYQNRSERRYMANGFLRAEDFHRIKDSL
jgi:hypothetical protein